jgi:hypothetical protein
MNYRMLILYLLFMYSLKAAGSEDEEWWENMCVSPPIPGLDERNHLSVSPIDWIKAISCLADDEDEIPSDPESEEEHFPDRVEERSAERRPHVLEIEKKEDETWKGEDYGFVAIRRDKRSINIRFGDRGYRLATFKEGINGAFNGLRIIGQMLYSEALVNDHSLIFETSVDQLFDLKEPLLDQWKILHSNPLVGDSVDAYLELGKMSEE